MIYCGIDNGVGGGICLLNESGGIAELFVMPTFKAGDNKRKADVFELRKIISNADVVVYERTSGAKSYSAAVSMADCYARVESVLMLSHRRRWPVTARTWQKEFWSRPKMPKGKTFDTKAAAMLAASRLWPDQSWLATKRCKTPHDGLIDAALIAEYGRRNRL